jgi:hypothetical protein
MLQSSEFKAAPDIDNMEDSTENADVNEPLGERFDLQRIISRSCESLVLSNTKEEEQSANLNTVGDDKVDVEELMVRFHRYTLE